jgi:hypothetical protein
MAGVDFRTLSELLGYRLTDGEALRVSESHKPKSLTGWLVGADGD